MGKPVSLCSSNQQGLQRPTVSTENLKLHPGQSAEVPIAQREM